MTNKKTLIFIGLSLIIAAIGLTMTFLNNPKLGNILIFLGLGIGQLFGLILLLRNGTIIGTLSTLKLFNFV